MKTCKAYFGNSDRLSRGELADSEEEMRLGYQEWRVWRLRSQDGNSQDMRPWNFRMSDPRVSEEETMETEEMRQ